MLTMLLPPLLLILLVQFVKALKSLSQVLQQVLVSSAINGMSTASKFRVLQPLIQHISLMLSVILQHSNICWLLPPLVIITAVVSAQALTQQSLLIQLLYMLILQLLLQAIRLFARTVRSYLHLTYKVAAVMLHSHGS